MTTQPKMNINYLTLTFRDSLEKEFRKYYFHSSIHLTRLSFLLGLSFYSLFAFLDAHVLPEIKLELFFIRFVIVCPYIILILILSYTKSYCKWWQGAAVLTVVVSSAGIIVMTIISPELGRNSYYAGIILVMVYGYMIIKQRFIYASIAGWIVIFLYIMSLILFPGVDEKVMITNTFFLISFNMLGMFGGYALEYYTRADFFHKHLLQKERAKVEKANTDLEEKVRNKTIDLQNRTIELEQIFEAIPDGIIYTDQKGQIIRINSAFEKMFGYRLDEILGSKTKRLQSDPDVFSFGTDQFSAGEPADTKTVFEVKYTRKDGAFFPGDTSCTSVKNTSQQVIGVLRLIRDITERKKTELQMKKDLKEKEILLRELYHRTKNNLQVISAMLRLRGINLNNPDVTQLFKEIEFKILGMALVHQQLYESGDLTRLYLEKYIKSLAQLIGKNLTLPSQNVAIHVKGEELSVMLETAMPIGLIINELVSNSLKHAFPDNRKGIINIDIRKKEDNSIILTIADNGIGLYEKFDPKKDAGLGLQTVFDLVEYQLQGRIDFKNNNGLEWVVSIGEELYESRV